MVNIICNYVLLSSVRERQGWRILTTERRSTGTTEVEEAEYS